MGNPIQKFEISESTCPASLLKDEISADFQTFWAIGNLDILTTNLLSVFCSIRCPGSIILKTYDCMRLLRDFGVAVVSGFHSPIEKDCLDILLKGTQPIVICPARGISRMRIPSAGKTRLIPAACLCCRHLMKNKNDQPCPLLKGVTE